MEKLLMVVHLRIGEEMDRDIRLLADAEHRPYLHQVRHLLSIGLQTSKRSKAFSVANGDVARHKSPQRITWDGAERRRA